MSDAPISVRDPVDPVHLVRAGWTNAELVWEQIQEAAADCHSRSAEAAELWRGALEVAREHLRAGDPRIATSLVNVAVSRRAGGDEVGTRALLDEALRCWDASADWIGALRSERSARSSTFHLRLETRHRGGYEHASRARFSTLAREGRAAIDAHLEPRTVHGDDPAAARRRRWRREKPAAFNDARKLLGAVLLMA